MSMMPTQSKQVLRTALLKKRLAIAKSKHSAWSRLICKRLKEFLSQRSYTTLMAYAPYRQEVNIMPLVEELIPIKHVCFPKVTGGHDMQALTCSDINRLEKGTYGIREVESSSEANAYVSDPLDIALVPGVGFSASKYRLGYGRGYYDRFLAKHPGTFKLGCFFECQYTDPWQVDCYDIPLHAIITEETIYA